MDSFSCCCSGNGKSIKIFLCPIGVLHYLIEKYNDELDDKSIKNLPLKLCEIYNGKFYKIKFVLQ